MGVGGNWPCFRPKDLDSLSTLLFLCEQEKVKMQTWKLVCLCMFIVFAKSVCVCDGGGGRYGHAQQDKNNRFITFV